MLIHLLYTDLDGLERAVPRPRRGSAHQRRARSRAALSRSDEPVPWGSRRSATERRKLAGQLKREYGRDHSLAELLEQHRTSAGRIRGLLLEHGVTLRPRGGAVR